MAGVSGLQGTEPQMSLKQFLANTRSGTERFYSISASLVHRLRKWSVELSELQGPRIPRISRI